MQYRRCSSATLVGAWLRLELESFGLLKSGRAELRTPVTLESEFDIDILGGASRCAERLLIDIVSKGRS